MQYIVIQDKKKQRREGTKNTTLYTNVATIEGDDNGADVSDETNSKTRRNEAKQLKREQQKQ